jgi:hypothetical protein
LYFVQLVDLGVKPVVSLGRIDSAGRREYLKDVSVVLVVLTIQAVLIVDVEAFLWPSA